MARYDISGRFLIHNVKKKIRAICRGVEYNIEIKDIRFTIDTGFSQFPVVWREAQQSFA